MVYQAKLVETGEMVAIKKVLQDKRFKNRELQIMRRLEHCNIVKLMYFFYTSGEKKDEIYLGRRRMIMIDSVVQSETETTEFPIPSCREVSSWFVLGVPLPCLGSS